MKLFTMKTFAWTKSKRQLPLIDTMLIEGEPETVVAKVAAVYQDPAIIVLDTLYTTSFADMFQQIPTHHVMIIHEKKTG